MICFGRVLAAGVRDERERAYELEAFDSSVLGVGRELLVDVLLELSQCSSAIRSSSEVRVGPHLLPLPPQHLLSIVLRILGTPERLLLDFPRLRKLLDIPLAIDPVPLALARPRSLGRLLARLGRSDRSLRDRVGGVGEEVAEEVDRVGEEGAELGRGEEEREELLERLARFGELF